MNHDESARSQQQHSEASNRILSELQSIFDEGVIDGGGMVTSFITIVESFDSEGESKLQVLWSDQRMTVLLGLLQYGSALIHRGMEV